MKLTSILFALASTTALVSADEYFCDLAKDNTGNLQRPYCCSGGYADSKGTDLSMQGHDCVDMTDNVNGLVCPNGSKVTCCYEIGPAHICTCHAKLKSQIGL